ncbi:MAG: DUF1761 domain-containing protein [Leptospiraceae bacterium]|nr:DUF1761 domain-containing protein [Leptospiraceae bacterium]
MMNIFWPAIGVGVLSAMVIGFLWYGPLFGKAWAKEVGVDLSKKPPAKEMVRSMGLMLLGAFLISYCLAHNIEAWRIVMGTFMASGKMPGMQPSHIPMGLAINSAIWTSVGYFVPVVLNQVAFEQKSWKLFFINVGYYVVTLTAMSFTMAYWVKTA